jgi:ubiquinone/menaquinone biosynthesis C-methylase UbiE
MVINENSEILIHCPHCCAVLEMNGQDEKCSECNKQLVVDGNVYDFVGDTQKQDEKTFYDTTYDDSGSVSRKKALDELEQIWESPSTPENRLVRNILGNVMGKTVVMVGNGKSRKELALLRESPNRLVYSDLSPNASIRIKKEVDCSGYSDVLRFAAIDAENLPFVDSSIDIIYGYAMVHHLPDVELFLREVIRVLKPGGKAVFMDDAYSPIWHYSKQTWLKLLMKRSHEKTGISPEDYRFSMSGGFREGMLAEIIEQVGGKPYFKRTIFLGYLVSRGAEKLLPSSMSSRVKGSWIHKSSLGIDKFMEKFAFYRKNQIRLVWGLEK